MAFMTAALAVVGAVAMLNIVLTFAVMRRLREHDTALANHSPDRSNGLLAVGAVADEFATTTTTGERLTRADLDGALMAFFSPVCGTCSEHIPGFLARAADDARALAVVVGTPSETAEMVRLLEPAGRVVVDSGRGGLADAFATNSFPAFYLVGDGGRVVANGRELGTLSEPVPA